MGKEHRAAQGHPMVDVRWHSGHTALPITPRQRLSDTVRAAKVAATAQGGGRGRQAHSAGGEAAPLLSGAVMELAAGQSWASWQPRPPTMTCLCLGGGRWKTEFSEYQESGDAALFYPTA